MVLQRSQEGSDSSECKKRKLNDDLVREEKQHVVIEPVAEAAGSVQISEPKTEGEAQRVSYKSQLHELCALNRWKPPVYESCESESHCHMKLFTVKVRIQFEEDSQVTVLECFGDPKYKKKAAAEHAAEVALWYLKHVGHTLETDKASGRQRQTKPSR